MAQPDDSRRPRRRRADSRRAQPRRGRTRAPPGRGGLRRRRRRLRTGRARAVPFATRLTPYHAPGLGRPSARALFHRRAPAQLARPAPSLDLRGRAARDRRPDPRRARDRIAGDAHRNLRKPVRGRGAQRVGGGRIAAEPAGALRSRPCRNARDAGGAHRGRRPSPEPRRGRQRPVRRASRSGRTPDRRAGRAAGGPVRPSARGARSRRAARGAPQGRAGHGQCALAGGRAGQAGQPDLRRRGARATR